MFETVLGLIGAGIMLTVAALAFSIGSRPEKIGAGAYILAWVSTLFVRAVSSVEGVQWGMLAIDLVTLAVFAGLVWKSGRSWPVWACALQLLVVVSHVMIIAHLPTPISSFYTVVNLTSYGILVAICFGTFWAWQEGRMALLTSPDSATRIR